MRPRRFSIVDGVGIFLAIVYAIPTLAYGMCTDQAAFFYMGRGWLHGAIPFRDAVEIKPPGIYAVHALAIGVFGERIWAIRVFDLAAVLAASIVAALCLRTTRPRPAGFIGVVTLFGVAAYFSCFDYWDTAQVEIWEGLFLLCAWALVDGPADSPKRVFGSGALIGVAFLFKFTALIVAPVIVLRVVLRAAPARRVVVDGLIQLAGGCAVLVLWIGYFAAHGALHAMIEVLYFIDRDYVVNKTVPWLVARGATVEWLGNHAYWCVTGMGAWLAGVVVALRHRERSVAHGALYALSLLLFAALSVAAQRKFFPYHWGILVPFAILVAAHGLVELTRALPRAALIVVMALVAGGLVRPPHWYSRPDIDYRSYVAAWLAYLRGGLSRAAFLEQFRGPGGYRYGPQEKLAQLIRRRARPGDQLLVHSFLPVFYVVSGLSCPGRYFSDHSLTDPEIRYRTAERWAEQLQMLALHPPRFGVGYSDDAFPANEYRLIRRQGPYALFERIQ